MNFQGPGILNTNSKNEFKKKESKCTREIVIIEAQRWDKLSTLITS